MSVARRVRRLAVSLSPHLALRGRMVPLALRVRFLSGFLRRLRCWVFLRLIALTGRALLQVPVCGLRRLLSALR